jgi:hypothetical protein
MDLFAPLTVPCVVFTSVDDVDMLDNGDSIIADFTFFSISYIRPLGEKYSLLCCSGKNFVVAIDYDSLCDKVMEVLSYSLDLLSSAIQSTADFDNVYDYAVVRFNDRYSVTSTM